MSSPTDRSPMINDQDQDAKQVEGQEHDPLEQHTPGLVIVDEPMVAPSPGRRRGGRARDFILADGNQVAIDPRGAFADAIVESYGNYLQAAGGRPRSVIRAEVEQAHLEWNTDQIEEETTNQAREESGRAGAVHFATVIGKSSIQFQLAALAIGSNKSWAREYIYPDEAQKIVMIACEIAGMEEYIKNSLTFPVTAVSPETAAEIKTAMDKAAAEAAVKAEAEEPPSGQADGSPTESVPSSAGSTD